MVEIIAWSPEDLLVSFKCVQKSVIYNQNSTFVFLKSKLLIDGRQNEKFLVLTLFW